MNQMPTRWLALAGAALLAACAQPNGDINKVQPNVSKKADLLDGQWYYRNTVTWTPATTGFTFAGHTGEMDKIVWEIQERNLVGYRAYPFIPGTDSNIEQSSKPSGTTAQVCGPDGKCVGGQKYYGAPLVAYPIQGHFDIQRNYSQSTGETGNVISENGSDRPWNQREYIRVDWSSNLIGKGEGMGWSNVMNPSGSTDLNAWIQPNEPGTDPYDWPTLEFGADKKLSYMDFTGRYYAQPDSYFFEGYGAVPMCFLNVGYRYDCTSQEIRMRTSLAKVDANRTNDYEPLYYGNDLMGKFGFFRTERLNYDRRFGNTESARIFLANRYRIFESSFEKDADGHPDHAKPIAFADRTLKPIVYYVSPASRTSGPAIYKQYLEAARQLEKGWDVAFRRAAAAAQGKQPSDVPQMLYICENPVPEKDSLSGEPTPAACGKVGFAPKFGDLRYSFLYTVTDPVPNGLLGYGPSSADPETGELISANANTYSAAVDSQSQYLMDVMDTILGEKSIDELVRGVDVKDYIARNRPYNLQGLNKNQGPLEAELQGIPQTNLETQGAFQKPTSRLAELFQNLNASGGLPVYTNDRAKVAADMLQQHPELESLLLDNPDVQKDVVGLLPPPLAAKAELDRDFARDASRSVLTRLTGNFDWQKKRLDWASGKNSCVYLTEFIDRATVSTAYREQAIRQARISELIAKGNLTCQNQGSCTASEARRIADDEVRRRLQQAIWRATSEHEIGHTFGLRHNFQASFDSVNYFDEYWKVRQPTLTVTQNGTPKIPRTPADLKASSDGTELQLAQGLHDYEYSSIMDYSGKINGDWVGPGKYDEAAILFAYSGGREPGYVEVFESARRDPKVFPGSDGKQMTITGAAYDLPLVNAAHTNVAVPHYAERHHYSVVPLHFGEGADLQTVMADGIQKLSKRKLAKWSDVKADTERVRAMIQVNPNPTSAELGSALLEVPYMFCSDYEVGGVLSCNRFDRGPDFYEIARTNIEDYWNTYFWNHFKRDRYFFSSNSAYNNAAGTFYDLASIYKHWVFAFYGTQKAGQQTMARYQYDPIVQDTWTMAVLDSANNNLSVMSVPPAGLYMYRDAQNAPGGIPQWDILSEGDDFDQLNAQGTAVITEYYADYYGASKFATLKRGEGRRMYSRYDYKSGFGFWDRMLEAGHYNDQMGALIAAVIPQADFLGVDYTADMNRYNIPYYLVFKKEFADTFGALWSNNEAVVRPVLYLTKDDAGQVTQTPALAHKVPIKGEDYITGFNFPRRLENCVGGQTTNCLSVSQTPAPANIQMTWTSRIYGLYLGMALFSVNYDMDYAKQNQIFKLGGSEQVQANTGYHPLEVADVVTGARYVTLERDGACTPDSPRPVVCSVTGTNGAACAAAKAACPEPFSTPAIRTLWIAKQYLQVVENPAICPMPQYLRESGDGACMPQDEATNPALVAQRKRDYTEYYVDRIRDLDLVRGMYAVYGKAF